LARTLLSPRRAARPFRRGIRAIRRPHSKLTAIRELIESDEVCADIVRYLVSHTEAADTARGIAEWWIGRDVAQTADALSRLQAYGVVRSYPVQDATSVFAFTKNPILRDTLRQYVRGLSAPTSARS
jgi:hypothetical protein